jgi:hypothetical protein
MHYASRTRPKLQGSDGGNAACHGVPGQAEPMLMLGHRRRQGHRDRSRRIGESKESG